MKTKEKEEIYGDESLSYLFDVEEEGALHQDYTTEMMEMITDVNSFKIGSVANGSLADESDSEIMFDVGAKDYVRVLKKKTELPFFEGKKIGDVMEVLITDKSEEPFNIGGSVAVIHESRAHESLSAIDYKGVVTVYVSELTPAGYNLDLIHDSVILDAFMPHTLAGINRLHAEARDGLVGTSINVMIESFSRERGTYIVSRRKYLKSLVPETLEALKHDEVYTGHVTGTTPFGVFVEFQDCLTGMIHKSNINPEYADSIKEIEAGTQIKFYVKEIIKEKIILTQIIKQTLWDDIEVGDIIEGSVKVIKPFGALVALDDETVGLIHKSEMNKVKSDEVMGENDVINVQILGIDRLNRKILLREVII